MTIRIGSKFDRAVFIGDDGKKEVLALGVAETLSAPANKPYTNLGIDEKHPYVVFVAGVPAFSSSKSVPERVSAMIANGAPVGMFMIMDVRTGEMRMLEFS